MSSTVKLGLGADNKFLEFRGVSIGPLWVHGFLLLLGLTCLLSSMGGHFVDDDMTNAPLFSHMFSFETTGLRVASVAIPIPLFWDLLADIYNLIYRKTNPAFQVTEGSVVVDAEWYQRMCSICTKEWWVRCTFLCAMLIPSSMLLFSDPDGTLGLMIIPYLTMFFRCICLFSITNGYMSDLYDYSMPLKIGSVVTTIIFNLGILMTFFGRVSISQSLSRGMTVGLCGILLSALSASLFAMRTIYHSCIIVWRELTSIESTITMEEYIFMCYTFGTTFVIATCFFSFYTTHGLRYDTVDMPVLITYRVLMIVGTMSSVVVSARAIRSWSFDVRLYTLTSRLEQLDSIVNSRLYSASVSEIERELKGSEPQALKSDGRDHEKIEDNKSLGIMFGNVGNRDQQGRHEGVCDRDTRDKDLRVHEQAYANETGRAWDPSGISTLSATRVGADGAVAADGAAGTVAGAVAVAFGTARGDHASGGEAFRQGSDAESGGVQDPLMTRTMARAAVRHQLASMHPRYDEVNPARWMHMAFSGENTSVFGGESNGPKSHL